MLLVLFSEGVSEEELFESCLFRLGPKSSWLSTGSTHCAPSSLKGREFVQVAHVYLCWLTRSGPKSLAKSLRQPAGKQSRSSRCSTFSAMESSLDPEGQGVVVVASCRLTLKLLCWACSTSLHMSFFFVNRCGMILVSK